METGTILIVDDNKSVLASLELLLENEFSTVRTAANPNQITTLLTTTSIDIVILDMNFSAGINNGNEGLYWLKHIHEIRPALPVVMLTAYGDVELAVKALKNGATDFLLKPWDNRTLVQKIKEAYNNKSNRKSSSKSFPQSARPILRYILSEFGCCSHRNVAFFRLEIKKFILQDCFKNQLVGTLLCSMLSIFH